MIFPSFPKIPKGPVCLFCILEVSKLLERMFQALCVQRRALKVLFFKQTLNRSDVHLFQSLARTCSRCQLKCTCEMIYIYIYIYCVASAVGGWEKCPVKNSHIRGVCCFGIVCFTHVFHFRWENNIVFCNTKVQASV